MLSQSNSTHPFGWLAASLLCLTTLCASSLVCSRTLGQEPQSVEWALDDQTMAVGWINPSTADFDSLRQLANDLGVPWEVNGLGEAKTLMDSLRTASATRIYVVVDFSAIMGQMPLVLISAKDPSAIMKLIPGMVPPQSGLEVGAQGSMVMIGPKPRIERLKGSKPSLPSAKLSETLAGASGDHGLVVAIPSVPREMLSNMLQSQTKEPTANQMASRFISGMEYGQFTISEKEKRFELKVGFSDPETAVFFGKLAADSIAPESNVPDKSRPTVADNTATWTIVGIDAMSQLLTAMPLIRQARENAQAMQGMNNLKQIALALLNFESAYQTFVPQALTSKDGKKLLSWRVMILPFLEQNELYQQFHFDEPWDSEHNIQLVEKMPKIYETAGGIQGKTAILTPLTPSSVFGRQGKPIQFRDITDGSSNTVWLLEVEPTDAVIWTKPDDYSMADEQSYKKLFLHRENVPVGLVDGSIRMFPKSFPYAEFQKLLSINGGEVVQIP